MRFEYKTTGTCAKVISFDVEKGNVIRNISFYGGCNGNLKALSKACEGKTAEEIKELFSGITCGMKQTSCSDQLSKAMQAVIDGELDGKENDEGTSSAETPAFSRADILIPAFSSDPEKMSKWSVVACDQYTSQPEYWDEVKNITELYPSTLQLIFPEIYLEEPDSEERIVNIHKKMREYLTKEVFAEYRNAFILTVRTFADGTVRPGLIGNIDLEKYDYTPGSQTPIRATEKTVVERIPPRLKVRKNAPIELPHVLVLIDDDKKNVIEPLCLELDSMKKLYDFELMMDGGRVAGYLLDRDRKENVINALKGLYDRKRFEDKYLASADMGTLVFAVGDGNHSLATAKASYEKIKASLPKDAALAHPARYALVELENVHCDALELEAIHRVIFGGNIPVILDKLTSALSLTEENNGGQHFTAVTKGGEKTYYVGKPLSNLSVGSLQAVLDEYLGEDKDASIDYIHGEDVVRKLASEKDDTIGFILPAMGKDELFKTVIHDGVLPRKTFSMGDPEEKRFYLEARKIR